MLESVSKTVTLIVTNVIKLAGLYVGVKAATHTPAEAAVLAFSAFLLAGAQVSETTVIGFIERFFGAKA